ncbi:ubiquitin/metalloprotease fusion protein [Schizosaccharomyces cryophilus OY26]|uniref:Ubiquitin/metalloprotease fusion protein n=1 Tax=Schizosaccharomyces cryophilus (strain OY26 / ATCC MYA-4695 / CBS 11777 / NBRC 106824 / NRRL Y48691) TaxID=653667 RepID=S9XE01_SCHCR|nr:ubiquitin/metalloprotease fusion protein [Schizosaccharomyces cryophilus OY26]EPY52006.1 ubiquitin/metalloprotease fusion protein [Schizosaccharomyces cryophilus OY26]
MELRFTYAGNVTSLSFHEEDTIWSAKEKLSQEIGFSPDQIKLLYKGSLSNESKLQDVVKDKAKIMTIVNKNANLINETISQLNSPRKNVASSYALKPKKPRSSPKQASPYTFNQLHVLDYPFKDRALKYLERLRDDAGIQRIMNSHQWTVSLLTEMDPAEHTQHDSKTLGLNHNHGAHIELRLRTDQYDGFRDYKTVKSTLIHELSHNVHGEHDASFWELFRQLTNEADAADVMSKPGRYVSEQATYTPQIDEATDEDQRDHKRDLLLAAAERRKNAKN